MQDNLSEPFQNDLPPKTSVTSRLMNIFVAPAEVFDEVKVSPYDMANWLVPFIIAAVAGIIYTMVVFSQPQILQHLKDDTDAKMRASFKPLLDKGKMTQQQADQQIDKIEEFLSPTFYKVTGIMAALVGSGIFMVLVALSVWLIGKFLFKASFTFGKAVEVVGLSAVITVPGTLATMCLAIIFGSIYMKVSPVLLLSHFDAHNRVHLLLSMLDVFILWYWAVVSMGLSKLSGEGFFKSALCIYGLWIVFLVLPAVYFGGK